MMTLNKFDAQQNMMTDEAFGMGMI